MFRHFVIGHNWTPFRIWHKYILRHDFSKINLSKYTIYEKSIETKMDLNGSICISYLCFSYLFHAYANRWVIGKKIPFFFIYVVAVSPTEIIPITTKSQQSQLIQTSTATQQQVATASSSSSAATVPLTSPPSIYNNNSTANNNNNQSSSYPAVLVGRTNSNCSSSCDVKSKVPPPVPPRGTPKSRRGGAGVDFGKGVQKNVIFGMILFHFYFFCSIGCSTRLLHDNNNCFQINLNAYHDLV